MLQNVWQDVRYGFRGLDRAPGVHARRDCHAGTRHRQRGRNFQRDPERSAGSGALQRRRSHRLRPDSRRHAEASRRPHGLSDCRSFSTTGNRVRYSKTSSAEVSKTRFSPPVTGRCSLPRASSRRIRFDSSACRRSSGGASSTSDVEPGAPPVFVMSHKMWLAQYSMDPGSRGSHVRAQRRANDLRRRDAAALHQAGRRSLEADEARPCRPGSNSAATSCFRRS